MYPLIGINSRREPGRIADAECDPLVVEELRSGQEPEVLRFLGERPGRTFGMTGFIVTNGLVSPHNYGAFYACRNSLGELQGVALIGRYILVETRSDSGIEVFARLAQECRNAHLMLGEQRTVETFWDYYADGGQAARRYCRELLFEQRLPVEVRETVAGLRLATLDDLELVVPAHAQSAFEESGIDPLKENAKLFRDRCARRIERGQTWVWVESGRLMFKAEILTNTADVAYLEGVWVDPTERGKGVGLRCLSQLTRKLLSRTRSVCLLVNESSQAARRFYQKAGYEFVGRYDTIFLRREVH